MNSKIQARCVAQANVFKALGHPSRLFIVQELANGERCVCELQQMIGADLSTVSKHLSILRNAGLVKDEKRGAKVFYQLAIPCVTNFLGCIDDVLEAEVRERSAALKK